MNDLYTQHRIVSWRVDVLDHDDQVIGELAYTGRDRKGDPLGGGVVGGSFSRSNARTVRGTGTLDMVASYNVEFPEWREVRLRPFYQLHAPDGTVLEAHPRGTFLPAVPGRTYQDGKSEFSINLYDKLLLPDRRKATDTYTALGGTTVTELVEQLLSEVGETRLSITHSDEKLRGPMSWEAGTSYLRIINDLLDTINYFSLWCDGWGRYRVHPYQRPENRPEAWAFADDERSIYAHGWTLERDEFNVPNQVILVSQPEGDEEPLTSIATNDDPDSPYSTVSVGHVNPLLEEGVEATSQRVLDDIAARRLAEVGTVTSRFSLDHLWIPLELNEVVSLYHSPSDTRVRAVLQSDDFSMDLDALVSSSLREIVG